MANETTAWSKTAIAVTAQQLAALPITGKKSDAAFVRIAAHWQGRRAVQELKNAWCAAFVYHCCRESGLDLPVWVMCREKERSFSASIAWVEWGERLGFCRSEADGYAPQRGDVVIYNHIIPKKYRQKDSLWCDHMGIVLTASGDTLTVAEGNVDNQNMSGIVTRRRGETIGCYICLPDGFCVANAAASSASSK